MKEFLSIMKADLDSEGFGRGEWLRYGVVLPLAYVAAIAAIGVIVTCIAVC